MSESGLNELNVKAILKQTGNGTVNSTDAFTSVGAQRPKANPEDQSSRERDLEFNRRKKERWTQAPVTPIEASDRQLSTQLELKPLLLGTWLTNGSWKSRFLEAYLGINDHREAQLRFNSIEKCDIELQRISQELGEDIFLDTVSQYLFQKLDAAIEKEKKFQTGKLTVGLELEIHVNQKREYASPTRHMPIDEQQRKIDALQHIGFEIGYDANREIPIPKSFSTHEQLKAFLLFIQSGLIEQTDNAGLHLNIKGLKRLDENLYLLEYMSAAAGLFRKNIPTDWDFDPLGEKNAPWAKLLFEGDPKSPKGLPFRVRESGIIEFRWLARGGGIEDYMKAAKGLEIFVQSCEAITAWQKVEDKNPDVTHKDRQLAAIWNDMRVQGLTELETYGISKDQLYYFEKDARKCANLEQQIFEHVGTFSVNGLFLSNEKLKENKRRRDRMYYEIFVPGRTRIKKILQGEDLVASQTDDVRL